MAEQNLILNILKFDHPSEKIDISFSVDPSQELYPVYIGELPKEITLSPTQSETQRFYINFAPNDNDQKITINLVQSPKFAKQYYNWLITKYMREKKIAAVTNPNFIKDNEFWIWDSTAKDNNYFIFKRFVIKVQINRIVESPELIISYEGVSKLFKKGLDQLHCPTEAINKVVYNGQLFKYDELSDEAKLNISKVRPVLNIGIRNALKIKWEPIRITNKLKHYYDEISWFVNTHLNTPEFKEIIPISSADFLEIPTKRIFNTTKGSNNLVFGNNATDLNPYNGLVKNGPFKPTPLNKIEFILIFCEKDRTTAESLSKWFDGSMNGSAKSLKTLLKMNYYLDMEKSIVFQDLNNPLPEIQQQLEKWPRIAGTKYFAVYITPHPKETSDKSIHSLYYQVKYELLKYEISSQVIETETILNSSFKYSIPNIAIAILAKLEGIPWRLHRTVQNELIVGIGAFKSIEMNSRYIGSAFCFSNDGHFQSFNCYSAHSTIMLAGSIRDSVENFLQKNHTVNRLVIHFYKRMSKKDLKPITETLQNLNLDIPVIVITINKTNSQDLVVFDKKCPNNNMIPVSGTFINIGKNQFLLCNNTRYGDSMPSSRDGFPFPVKLTLFSTDESVLTNKTITELIDQVYQFSRMYWTSVTQQHLPVTVKYPEMVAEKYPHFESNKLPPFGKENLWFL